MAKKQNIEELLGAVPESQDHAAKRDRTHGWLQDRRRERARKGVRRRVKKTLQLLWDIETRLVTQGFAFTSVHQSLMNVIENLNAFVDDYNQKT